MEAIKIHITRIVNGYETKFEISEEEYKELTRQRHEEQPPSKTIFSLTMSNVGSWNDKWTGDGIKYYIIKDKLYETAIANSPFFYDFGDGWIAKIEVKAINSFDASLKKKESKGFCGYDWMVNSIINNGKIVPNGV